MAEKSQLEVGALTMDESSQVGMGLDDLRALASGRARRQDEAHVCPHCMRSASDAVFAPSDEDKRAWVRVVLGGSRFVKTYQLFGGLGSITFQTYSIAEREQISTELARELASGRLAGGSSDAAARLVSARALELRMAVSFVGQDKSLDGKSPVERFDAIFGSRSEDFYVVARQTYVEFEALSINLRLGAASPDFWKGIELRS